MVSFTINDAFMKALADELPLFQAIFLRGIGTVLILAVLAYALGQMRFDFSRRVWGLMGLRALAEVCAAMMFLQALFNMPIANVTAVLQALPLTVTLAGAVILGEAVGWRRLGAILVGFVGVCLIVQPGTDGFSVYSLYALAAVICVTVRDLVARRLPHDVPSMMAGLVAAAAVMTAGGLLGLTAPWAELSQTAAWQLIGAMAAILVGSVMSVSAMRHGELGFVSLFRYSALVAALIVGWVIFAEWPDMWTWIGALIIVAMGAFTLYRERQMRRRAPIGRPR